MYELSRIFKAYDVRGRVPEEWDDAVAYAIGHAFAEDEPRVVVGHDMRASSPSLAQAVGAGAVEAGSDVLMLGLAATDEVYFASGSLGRAGVAVTASHNPGHDNGLKFCRPGAVPVGGDTGLDVVEQRAAALLAGSAGRRNAIPELVVCDVLPAYVAFLHELVPVSGRHLSVVVDAGNGMAGLTVPAVFAGLDVDLHPMFFELDGSFPNHEANPLDPANLATLQATVRETGADVGLAFDGDADRCFVVDEAGDVVSPSALTGLIAVRELASHPGATVIHNLITSRAVAEVIQEHGGHAVRTRVGHSFIKQAMADHDAVFGGEHSGHFYFRDFWYADSGMLAALHVLASLAASDRPLTAGVADYQRYTASGEINVRTADVAAATERVQAVLASAGTTVDRLDGLTISHPDWWLNVRPSNTEPLLRLNVEAVDAAMMETLRDTAVALMRG